MLTTGVFLLRILLLGAKDVTGNEKAVLLFFIMS